MIEQEKKALNLFRSLFDNLKLKLGRLPTDKEISNKLEANFKENPTNQETKKED